MGVLLMLMTIGGLALAAIPLAVAWLNESTWLKNFVMGGVTIWLVFYVTMLIGISLTSTEKVLPIGEAKEYCGFYLDCHMHTAVTGVRRAKTIGNKTAIGEFYIAKVKVFSDAKNPSIAFRLLEPKARIVLPDGDKIARDIEAEDLLPTAGASLGDEIKGRETVEKDIVFDVVEPSANLRLLITEGYGIDNWIERFLVGDEDSIFHAQTFFALKQP